MQAIMIQDHLDLRRVKKIFLGLCLLVFFAAPVDLVAVRFSNPVAENSIANPGFENPNPGFQNISLEPLSAYLEAIGQSRFFGFIQPAASLPILQSSIQELIKDYRLKGVILMDEPEAIIEDARTQKTTFVRKGDKLGGTTITAIEEGIIQLEYFGETKELRLQ